MENAELIGVSRQLALRSQMDTIANNLANLNTAGFKRQQMTFEEYLMPVAETKLPSGGVGERLSFVQDSFSRSDHTQGAIVDTGNPLDVAIEGKGWFVVETPSGPQYTRDGSFKVSAAGELVTSSGHRVLGQGGAITFTNTEVGISIARDGSISSSAGERGKLQLVDFEGPNSIDPTGGNLFRPKEGIEPTRVEFASVRQGAIENSNVKPVVEMTRMIEVTRAYQALAKLIDDQKDVRSDAIRTLGRIDP